MLSTIFVGAAFRPAFASLAAAGTVLLVVLVGVVVAEEDPREGRYRVLLEVELQLGRDAVHQTQVRRYVRQTRSRFAVAWRKTLPECPSSRVDEASRLAVAALRGLALERALEGSRFDKSDDRETVLRAVLDVLG